MKMLTFTLCGFLLVLVVSPSNCRLEDVTISHPMYLTAVADVINEEYARLGKDVQEFSPIMSDCTKKLNTTSDACQTCLQTVECGSTVIEDHGGDNGGRGFKPIDLIHLINPVDFLKDPLNNIVSKLGKAGGKFAKTVGKHLVKGLKAIADGFDDTVIDGLKDSLKGLKNLGEHLGKAVKGLGKGLGKIIKPVGKFLTNAVKATGKGVKHVVKAVGKGVKHVFRGLKSAGRAVGKGVKHVVRGIGKGVKSAGRAVVRGVKKVWRGFKSLFGRRRRSATTQEEKLCMAKCPDCIPFISGNEIAAVRAVCGVDIVDRNATIAAEVALIDEFFNDVNEAEIDLLKEIKVNTTSGLLTKVTALVRGKYRSFSTNVKFEAFDPTSMYKNLATYIYKNYFGL